MKIFITGATGFIGKNLVKRLEPKGHEIFCLVREKSNIDHLRTMNVTLVTGDITDFECIKKHFNEIKPDRVFHCAAKVMSENQKELYAHNVRGTQNICEVSYLFGVKRLVYLSSVSVVSGNTEVPITDELKYKSSNRYGDSKIDAECLVAGYRNRGLPCAIIRPCMVYGEDEKHMMNKVLLNISRHRIFLPVTPRMFSRLNLVYIDNVIDVMEIAMERNEALNGTFIVADTEIITIRKFFDILYDEMDGSTPPIIPERIFNFLMIIPLFRKKANKYLKDRVYDISRLRNVLNYIPKVRTEEGLRRIVRAWKNRG